MSSRKRKKAQGQHSASRAHQRHYLAIKWTPLLDQPYEPVKKPVKAPKSKKSADQEAKLFPLHNQLYKGDIIEVMSKWPDNHFDACITDPPYNIASDRKGLSWAFSSHVTIQDKWDRFTPDEYEQFTVNWLEQVCRVTKENGNIFIFGSYHNIYTSVRWH